MLSHSVSILSYLGDSYSSGWQLVAVVTVCCGGSVLEGRAVWLLTRISCSNFEMFKKKFEKTTETYQACIGWKQTFYWKILKGKIFAKPIVKWVVEMSKHPTKIYGYVGRKERNEIKIEEIEKDPKNDNKFRKQLKKPR